jgi:hypothetical protein
VRLHLWIILAGIALLIAAGCVELHRLAGDTRFPPPDDSVDLPTDGEEEPPVDEAPDDNAPPDEPDDVDTTGMDDTPPDDTPAGPMPPDDDEEEEPPPDDSTNGEEPVEEPEPEGIPPLPDDAEIVTLDSGLQVYDFVVGVGDAPPDESADVNVAYTGYLPDGAIFDSNESANFNLQGVIAGFSEGILGMRVGGSRRIIIPPDLGYGPGGNPGAGIGGEDTIVFDVDLLAINE